MYTGLKTAIYKGSLMDKYLYPKKIEEAIKLLEKYKAVSGGNLQTNTRESAGVDLQKKGRREKHNTDSEKYLQVNKSVKSHLLHFGQDWATGKHW